MSVSTIRSDEGVGLALVAGATSAEAAMNNPPASEVVRWRPSSDSRQCRVRIFRRVDMISSFRAVDSVPGNASRGDVIPAPPARCTPSPIEVGSCVVATHDDTCAPISPRDNSKRNSKWTADGRTSL
jgi:hypothetical protein